MAAKGLQNLSTSTDQAIPGQPTRTLIASDMPMMLRIPTEMRSKIFHYLLPDKQKHIEPTSILKERKQLEKERDGQMFSRFRERARAQHREAHDLRAHSNFYGAFNPRVHSARFAVPFSADSFEIPMDFSVEAFGDVYAMPSANKLSFSFDDEIIWSPSTASSPPSVKKPPSADLKEMSGSTVWSPSSTSSTFQEQLPTFEDPLTEEELNGLNEAVHEEQYDAIPLNMTLNLMSTHPLFATEISTILYEEYTFEIRVHPNGIDFLHLPRIATYEYYGTELAQQMAQFQKQGHFSFQRMRHLSFVLVGGSVESRTATWRMRKNIEDLVEMIGDLASLEVRFSGDDAFWKVGGRVRMGTADVSVVEMVCAPFAAGLYGVGKVDVFLPEALEEDENLLEWQEWIENRIVGSEQMEKNGMWELKEVAMFEATRVWEYRQRFHEGDHTEDYAWIAAMDMDTEDEEESEDEEMEYESDAAEDITRFGPDGISR